ncbi:MAG: hypothetical protein M3Y24_13320 [Acidobacteriota bacterium]|nr:hypothetical protein [Acidobacteriota bacterium]
MKSVECQFESDVLSAVAQSRWPQQVDASLREHVTACAICADVAAVAAAFDFARHETNALPALPDASRVWWLAQLRARREAAKAAARPITATQLIAFAWAVGLLAVCLGTALTWFQSARNWIASTFASFDATVIVSSVTASLVGHGALILCTAALVLLLPAAAYFAMGRD